MTTDSQTRAASGIACALAILAVLSSCTLPTEATKSSPEPLFTPSTTAPLRADEVHDEFTRAVEEFPEPLPDELKFPDTLPSTFDRNALSEPGVGQSIAYFFWACAWQDRFLVAYEAGDAIGQDEALDALEKWTTTAFYANQYDDPQDLWTTMMILPAREGDVREISAYFESGCSSYRQLRDVGAW